MGKCMPDQYMKASLPLVVHGSFMGERLRALRKDGRELVYECALWARIGLVKLLNNVSLESQLDGGGLVSSRKRKWDLRGQQQICTTIKSVCYV